MAFAVNASPSLYDALKAEGFVLPDECCDVLMVMSVDGVYQLHYKVNLRPEDLAKVGVALQKIADAQSPELRQDGPNTKAASYEMQDLLRKIVDEVH